MKKLLKFRNVTSQPTYAYMSLQVNLCHLMSTPLYFYSSYHAVISIFAHVKDEHITGNNKKTKNGNTLL